MGLSLNFSLERLEKSKFQTSYITDNSEQNNFMSVLPSGRGLLRRHIGHAHLGAHRVGVVETGYPRVWVGPTRLLLQV